MLMLIVIQLMKFFTLKRGTVTHTVTLSVSLPVSLSIDVSADDFTASMCIKGGSILFDEFCKWALNKHLKLTDEEDGEEGDAQYGDADGADEGKRCADLDRQMVGMAGKSRKKAQQAARAAQNQTTAGGYGGGGGGGGAARGNVVGVGRNGEGRCLLEIQELVRSLSAEDAQRYVSAGEGGGMTKQERLGYHRSQQHRVGVQRVLYHAFKRFDLNGGGIVTRTGFHAAFTALSAGGAAAAITEIESAGLYEMYKGDYTAFIEALFVAPDSSDVDALAVLRKEPVVIDGPFDRTHVGVRAVQPPSLPLGRPVRIRYRQSRTPVQVRGQR